MKLNFSCIIFLIVGDRTSQLIISL
jgi:hypothetical protein